MTTKRTYECNVCRVSAQDGHMRGFMFGHRRVDWTTIQQAENHICDNCVTMLMVSFRDKGITDQFDGLQAERETIANKARQYAGYYPEASDGRNTFILLAEWIEARATKPAEAA